MILWGVQKCILLLRGLDPTPLLYLRVPYGNGPRANQVSWVGILNYEECCGAYVFAECRGATKSIFLSNNKSTQLKQTYI
jgi:hypothetical protein